MLYHNPIEYDKKKRHARMKSSESSVTLDKIIALCKRKGFVYPSADIYGGINGVYEFGHLGTLIKENIRQAWLSSLATDKGTILRFEGALLGPEAVWKASGHLENFTDPMVDCLECQRRYRADEIDLNKACPNCGKKNWTEQRQFNLMFKTQLGAMSDNASSAYLRPETAQAIFVNFKNMIATNRVHLPFGIAQIGKAFRNEITPKQFLFRMREFEQMELEWFCKPENSESFFGYWLEKRQDFYRTIGINQDKLRIRAHEKTELSHYSNQTSDFEYHFPFGWKELEGIAHRGNFDLTQHTNASGKDLSIFDEASQKSIIPHVIECSLGVDRLFLTLLFDAYHEDIIEGETRIMLKLHPRIAPIKAAFLPLSKKLSEPIKKIYQSLALKGYSVAFDESGSIGKRYRRQDEIGTPLCFTYDFDSEADQTVTVRNRDTTKQERIAIDHIESYIIKILT